MKSSENDADEKMGLLILRGLGGDEEVEGHTTAACRTRAKKERERYLKRLYLDDRVMMKVCHCAIE